MVTTFGVGELSAVNGIAGSYAERASYCHHWGTYSSCRTRRQIRSPFPWRRNFDDYRKMFEPITTAQAYITPDNATTEIPRVINTALQQRRPVHIHLPIDVALTEIEISNPFKPEVEPQKRSKLYQYGSRQT